jgi:2-polyprenyl-3-methyl-5-hydroxy-6-metoxy-1,4-benzoquinol methylase
MRALDDAAPHDATWYLGRVAAQSRWLREQAFFGLLDEMIDGNQSHRHEAALDVGCGAGYLLSALARSGWSASGVEMDPRAAAVAEKTSGCAVRVGQFLSLDLPRHHFRLITMSHVFEHVSDPVAVLERIAQLLLPGGRAVLVFPNPQSLGAKIYGRHWFPWDAPRHLVLPSVKALAVMGRAAGLALTTRSLARSASGYASLSNAYVTKTPLPNARKNLLTRVFAAGEQTLCALGLPVGEETAAIFTRLETA